jgi:hypothetical protein
VIRPVLRAYIPTAAILCLIIGVLCLPDGSGLDLAERAPAWLLWTGGILAGSLVAILASAVALHRLNDLLDLYGMGSHQRHIADAEARGEAPN